MALNDQYLIPRLFPFSRLCGNPVISYAEKLPLNDHVDLSSRARGVNFGLNLHLHPYYVIAGSYGSGQSAQVHRLASAFVV